MIFDSGVYLISSGTKFQAKKNRSIDMTNTGADITVFSARGVPLKTNPALETTLKVTNRNHYDSASIRSQISNNRIVKLHLKQCNFFIFLEISLLPGTLRKSHLRNELDTLGDSSVIPSF